MTSSLPPVVCIVGRKNAGKTEVTVALAGELNRRGYRVMTAKHGHGFHLDRPGKDSWRHRHEGGARRTVLAAPTGYAVLGEWPREEKGRGEGAELPLAELVRRHLYDADVVLAEGFKTSGAPKVEVIRSGLPEGSLVERKGEDMREYLAIVTDREDVPVPVPVLSMGDPAHTAVLARLVEERVLAIRSPGSSPEGA